MSDYVWWQDMQALTAAAPMSSTEQPDDDPATGFKPRDDEDPPWVTALSYLLMFLSVVTFVVVVVASVHAN